MNQYFENLIEALIHEHGPKVLDKAKGIAKDLLQSFMNHFKGASELSIFNYEVTTLDVATLLEYCRKHQVKDSNGVAALKAIKNNTNIIYLAYVKDRDLISPKENNYIIIKALTMTDEVMNLFDGQELVILK